jgi:hypothetical protein
MSCVTWRILKRIRILSFQCSIIFSGYQPCQNGAVVKCFRGVLCFHRQGMMWWDQLTKKLIKGRVRHRRETSCLVKYDHSCVWNAFLEMVNVALKWNSECAYDNRVLSWRKALTCQTREYYFWWEIIPSSNLSFMKRISVVWLSGSLALKCSDHFGWWPPWLGKAGVPLLNYCPGICLTIERESTKKLSQGTRVAKSTTCADLHVFWGTASAGMLHISSPLLPAGTSVSRRSAQVPSELPYQCVPSIS